MDEYDFNATISRVIFSCPACKGRNRVYEVWPLGDQGFVLSTVYGHDPLLSDTNPCCKKSYRITTDKRFNVVKTEQKKCQP